MNRGGGGIGGLVVLVFILGAAAGWWDGLLPSSSDTATPTMRPFVAATSHPTLRPTTGTPRPTRSPTPAPTPTPTATPEPFAISDFTYLPTACWSSDWFDSEGHNTPGMELRFTAKIKNVGAAEDQRVYVTLETTDLWATTPALSRANWKGARWFQETRSLVLMGPPVKPGKTLIAKWRIVLHTPFDSHYTVEFSSGRALSEANPDPRLTLLAGYEMWTANMVC